MASSPDIRRRLDALGRRRKRLDADQAQLMKDTESVLREAYGDVPVSEAARRLNIHRTTVYRVYDPQGAP